MPKQKKKFEAEIEIPQGCTFALESKLIRVKGPKGEITRPTDDKKVIVKPEGNTINITYDKSGQREKKKLFTLVSHIKNMLKGVQEGYNYKLKICSGHFPMAVTVKGDTYEVKNFIGEKVPRTMKIPAGVKVTITAETINVDGIDKELTGQTAAGIEKLTRRPGFDKRVFQDGVYIIEKDGEKLKA